MTNCRRNLQSENRQQRSQLLASLPLHIVKFNHFYPASSLPSCRCLPSPNHQHPPPSPHPRYESITVRAHLKHLESLGPARSAKRASRECESAVGSRRISKCQYVLTQRADLSTLVPRHVSVLSCKGRGE